MQVCEYIYIYMYGLYNQIPPLQNAYCNVYLYMFYAFLVVVVMITEFSE